MEVNKQRINAMDNDLKVYREKELKNYVIGNTLIILVLSGTLETLLNIAGLYGAIDDVLSKLGVEIISAGILSSILYSYVFILDAIIPGNWKDYICNFGRPLPGEVIFDEMKKNVRDKRFRQEDVLAKYADVYEKIDDLTGQKRKAVSNSEWYAVYREHEDEKKVFFSHRDYLLCRDFCISTLLIGLMYFVLSVLSIVTFDCKIIVMLVIEVITTNIAMRNKQKRFAYNVIAADIHPKKECSKNETISKE